MLADSPKSSSSFFPSISSSNAFEMLAVHQVDDAQESPCTPTSHIRNLFDVEVKELGEIPIGWQQGDPSISLAFTGAPGDGDPPQNYGKNVGESLVSSAGVSMRFPEQAQNAISSISAAIAKAASRYRAPPSLAPVPRARLRKGPFGRNWS